jgi:hypothetical protein
MDHTHHHDQKTDHDPDQRQARALFQVNERAKDHGQNAGDDAENIDRELLLLVLLGHLDRQLVSLRARVVELFENRNNGELVVAHKQQPDHTDNKSKGRQRSHDMQLISSKNNKKVEKWSRSENRSVISLIDSDREVRRTSV